MNPGSWAPELLLLAPGQPGLRERWEPELAEDWIARLHRLPQTAGRTQPPPSSSSVLRPQSRAARPRQDRVSRPLAQALSGVWGGLSSGQWNAINRGRKWVGGRAAGDKMWRVEESEEGPALQGAEGGGVAPWGQGEQRP